MFQTFNRTEESWGKAAHIEPKALEKILALGDSLKHIGPVNSKSSKKFTVWQTESLTVERKSHPRTVYSTSQDKAVQEARISPFDPIPTEAYEEIQAVLKKHGLSTTPRVIISSHRAT